MMSLGSGPIRRTFTSKVQNDGDNDDVRAPHDFHTEGSCTRGYSSDKAGYRGMRWYTLMGTPSNTHLSRTDPLETLKIYYPPCKRNSRPHRRRCYGDILPHTGAGRRGDSGSVEVKNNWTYHIAKSGTFYRQVKVDEFIKSH